MSARSNKQVGIFLAALLFLHALSIGPLAYVQQRAWIPYSSGFIKVYFWPEEEVMEAMTRSESDVVLSLGQQYTDYIMWWRERAMIHEGVDPSKEPALIPVTD